MQYWKPSAPDQFVGDMMPFWDGHRFHLFYLLDRDHHEEQNGLGGHQWAHASSLDLVSWQHHPLALPIGEAGSVDQHGICTGSIFQASSTYRAFYATRIRDADGAVSEAICQASSGDLIHFTKSPSNPMFGAPQGLDPRAHRDPHVLLDTQGGFHMLVTASLAGPDERGVLAHYVSGDGESWSYHGPFLSIEGPTPECPEHFEWNGWYYLVYSQHAQLQYWISRGPLGPWQRARRNTIEGSSLAVPRTADFNGRRIAVGFLPWRQDSHDAGGWAYAGNAIFRELTQDEDGTLSTRFVPEMMPATSSSRQENTISLEADQSAQVSDVPLSCTLSLRMVPGPSAREFGLLLRAGQGAESGYRLSFEPGQNRVVLQRWPNELNVRAEAREVEGLEQAVDVTVCMEGSIIDVCINQRRTLVARCFDYQGTTLGLFAQGGEVRFEGLSIAALLA